MQIFLVLSNQINFSIKINNFKRNVPPKLGTEK